MKEIVINGTSNNSTPSMSILDPPTIEGSKKVVFVARLETD